MEFLNNILKFKKTDTILRVHMRKNIKIKLLQIKIDNNFEYIVIVNGNPMIRTYDKIIANSEFEKQKRAIIK